MQAAKSLLTLLALGLCVTALSQARPDTEAQAQAREALRKKIAELEGQPVGATPAPAVTPNPTAAPAATAATTATPAPPASSTPVAAEGAGFSSPPAAGQATPEQIERLREATRQKIAELNTKGKTAPEATPPAAVAETPAAVVVAPATVVETPAKSAAERRAEEKAAAAEQKRLAEEAKAREKAAAEAASALAAQEKAKAKAEANPAPKASAFEPLPAPPTNIAASKEARLAELLKKYKADEITPEQYHTERSKVLAEP